MFTIALLDNAFKLLNGVVEQISELIGVAMIRAPDLTFRTATWANQYVKSLMGSNTTKR